MKPTIALCVVTCGLSGLLACGETAPAPEAPQSEPAAQGTLEDAWLLAVVQPNVDAAKAAGRADADAWLAEDAWDQALLQRVEQSIQKMQSAPPLFAALEEAKDPYATVLQRMRDAKLPEAFAAIPMAESRYHSKLQSPVCARGPWQLMPEVAHRVSELHGVPMRIEGCALRSRPDETYAVTADSPLAPPTPLRDAPYIAEGRCDIVDCEVDDRTDLTRSTDAALELLKGTWMDTDVSTSGAAVQLAILAHNAGFNDSIYGFDRPTNVLPALTAHLAEHGDATKMYGSAIRCPSPSEPADGNHCGSTFTAESQHYGYSVIALHVIASCYYGRHHADMPAFAPWAEHAQPGGYCDVVQLPEVAVSTSGAP